MELLDKIKSAEKDAESLVAAAKRDADELIRSARHEADCYLEDGLGSCRRDALKTIAEAESAAHDRSAQRAEENQESIETLRNSAASGIDEAVDLIIQNITEIS